MLTHPLVPPRVGHARVVKPQEAVQLGIALSAVLLAGTSILAIVTRQNSRSDMINQFIETGTRSQGPQSDPFTAMLLIIITPALFQGEFLIIDAIKSTLLRIRLHNVDRHRAAVILATLLEHPTGLEPLPAGAK